jgi:dolichol kinase
MGSAETATFELSRDLHALLSRIDPASFREELEAEVRAQLASIVARCRALFEMIANARDANMLALREKLTHLLEAFDRAVTNDCAAPRVFWANFQRAIHPEYESLAAWLSSESIAAPHLRPTNHARNVFHVCSALLALTVISVAPAAGWIALPAGLFFVFCWTMELSRRNNPRMNDRLMRFFGPVAHAHERYRVNSATWYSTALMTLSLLAAPPVSAVAVAVLGIGDPTAALVGRRWGRIRLRGNRSLEGSTAFFIAASLAAFLVAHLLMAGSTALHLEVALVAGLSGALVELFSSRLDDNLTIPLGVAAAVSAMLRLIRG